MLPTQGLVPPTSKYFDSSSSAESTPSVSFSSTTSNNSDSGFSTRARTKPQRQSTSEAAIVSIYSMYTDDQPMRASWVQDNTKDVPQIKLDCRQSYLSQVDNRDSTELAYFQDNTVPIIDLTDAGTSSARLSSRDSNNSSSIVPSKSRPTSSFDVLNDHRRRSTGHSYRTTATSLTSGPLSIADSSYSPSRFSRKSGELPPLPMSPTPPPPSPSFNRNSETLEVPTSSPQQVSLHSTPPPLPLKHPVYTGSPMSKTSLVPSEGEDLDSFHVRNTYAQLDISGVKGDGFDEGVERTRARIGDSRISQLNAEAALGDGTEKTKELDPREAQVLAMVDRYGFFSSPSHDRLMLLPSAPLLRHLGFVHGGPKNAPVSGTSLKALPPPQSPLKEGSRIGKWERMLRPSKPDPGGILAWSIRPAKEAKLSERTYKGIPDRWRNAAWELLLSRFTKEHTLPINRAQMTLAKLAQDYADNLDKPSSYDIQIDLDVPRTISGHIMFKTRYGAGQRSLFHVLHSFSLRCEKCGYVQGMGPIAATLLCYFTPEQVYASLVRLHDAYGMHDIFSPGFPGLLEAIYVQERILEQMLPDVYKAFKTHMISTTSYATKWYITLFANSVPFQTQLRLWDVFFLDGEDVFIAVAVAIVWVFKGMLLLAVF
ncbi:rab-GTPase-TBC domain-containing protein [Lentinula raphanica]|nr:rab-GTPase-TBC domain-containing protein [Lentinula raphanica]